MFYFFGIRKFIQIKKVLCRVVFAEYLQYVMQSEHNAFTIPLKQILPGGLRDQTWSMVQGTGLSSHLPQYHTAELSWKQKA